MKADKIWARCAAGIYYALVGPVWHWSPAPGLVADPKINCPGADRKSLTFIWGPGDGAKYSRGASFLGSGMGLSVGGRSGRRYPRGQRKGRGKESENTGPSPSVVGRSGPAGPRGQGKYHPTRNSLQFTGLKAGNEARTWSLPARPPHTLANVVFFAGPTTAMFPPQSTTYPIEITFIVPDVDRPAFHRERLWRTHLTMARRFCAERRVGARSFTGHPLFAPGTQSPQPGSKAESGSTKAPAPPEHRPDRDQTTFFAPGDAMCIGWPNDGQKVRYGTHIKVWVRAHVTLVGRHPRGDCEGQPLGHHHLRSIAPGLCRALGRKPIPNDKKKPNLHFRSWPGTGKPLFALPPGTHYAWQLRVGPTGGTQSRP